MILMKINAKLKNNIVKLLYKLINNLLNFNNLKKKMRLYVSIKTLKYKVFKLIHDEMKHFNYARTYKKLIRDIYIFNIFIKLYKYLRHYPHYQLY